MYLQTCLPIKREVGGDCVQFRIKTPLSVLYRERWGKNCVQSNLTLPRWAKDGYVLVLFGA